MRNIMRPYFGFPVIVISLFLGLMEIVSTNKDSHHSKFHFIDVISSQIKHLQKKYLNIQMDIEKFELLSTVPIQSLISTVIISLVPFILLGFIPKSSCHTGSKLMRFLLGFAVGSLLGDTLLHLIPHSMDSSHGESHEHDKLSKKFITISYPLLGGMLTFYIIESLIRIIKHRMNQTTVGVLKKKDSEPTPSTSNFGVVSKKSKNKHSTPNKANPSKSLSVDSNEVLPESGSKKKRAKNRPFYKSTLSTVAFLNFMTDFSHNFLDGMAISAAYQKSFRLGLATTIGVLIHEIPHEICDFAILIKVGFTKWKAAFFQLITAVGAILGTYVGLYLSRHGINNEYPQWVLPFIAGGFIYISCICVVPEMLNEPNPRIFKLVIEVTGMVFGISLMEIFNNLHVH